MLLFKKIQGSTSNEEELTITKFMIFIDLFLKTLR